MSRSIALRKRHLSAASDDLPHTAWPVDPITSKKRGRLEDYKSIMAEWVKFNPCASPEDRKAASERIWADLQ